MEPRTATVSGKIILSGEYAMLFGHRGVAVPSEKALTASWDPAPTDFAIVWPETERDHLWRNYLWDILGIIEARTGVPLHGTLTIRNALPLGKGMGSSTALVIATARCFLGKECEAAARSIEDSVNPGHSGMDFAVIWRRTPLAFSRESGPQPIALPADLLAHARFMDTGTPNETTPELVAWVRGRYESEDTTVREAITAIGRCTERLISGEDLAAVMRDHHRAQLALGVVPEDTAELIKKIEQEGGSAKVIGAGGRTGGGGMVLSLTP